MEFAACKRWPPNAYLTRSMPKCETCGFSHAQSHHCINCGNPDPFRRLRVVKFSLLVLSLIVMTGATFLFYQRYARIERAVREAEQQNVLMPAPVPSKP